MPLLQTTTGKENQRFCFAEVHAFHCPANHPERPLFSAAKKVGATATIPAINRFDVKIGGAWFTQGYDCGEGQIIKIWASRKDPITGVPDSAAIYIRMRETAALRTVKVRLLGLLDSSTLAEAPIHGRFDVIPARELRQLGVEVKPEYAYQASSAQVSKLFTVTVDAPEVAPRAALPKAVDVQTAVGVKAYVAPTRNRALSL